MEEGWKSDSSQLGVAAFLSPGGYPHDTPSLAGGLCGQAGGSKNDWQGPWMPLQSSYSQEGSRWRRNNSFRVDSLQWKLLLFFQNCSPGRPTLPYLANGTKQLQKWKKVQEKESSKNKQKLEKFNHESVWPCFDQLFLHVQFYVLRHWEVSQGPTPGESLGSDETILSPALWSGEASWVGEGYQKLEVCRGKEQGDRLLEGMGSRDLNLHSPSPALSEARVALSWPLPGLGRGLQPPPALCSLLSSWMDFSRSILFWCFSSWILGTSLQSLAQAPPPFWMQESKGCKGVGGKRERVTCLSPWWQARQERICSYSFGACLASWLPAAS